MIRVVAKHIIKEECIDAFLVAVRNVMEVSTKHPGNISYTLGKSLDDPTVFTLFEEWEDMDSIKAHLEREDFQTNVAPIMDMMAEQVPLDFYEII